SGTGYVGWPRANGSGFSPPVSRSLRAEGAARVLVVGRRLPGGEGDDVASVVRHESPGPEVAVAAPVVVLVEGDRVLDHRPEVGRPGRRGPGVRDDRLARAEIAGARDVRG